MSNSEEKITTNNKQLTQCFETHGLHYLHIEEIQWFDIEFIFMSEIEFKIFSRKRTMNGKILTSELYSIFN